MMLPVCGLRQAKGLGYPSTDRIKVFDKHLWRTVGPSTSYPEWGGGAQRQPSIHKKEQDGPSLTTTRCILLSRHSVGRPHAGLPDE